MFGHAQLDQRAVERWQAELKDYTYELLFDLYDKVEYWDFWSFTYRGRVR